MALPEKWEEAVQREGDYILSWNWKVCKQS